MSYESNREQAETLIEALPYIQKFRGQLFVIKYGGAAMEDENAVERLLRDVVFLEAVGINPVLIHGGGKRITSKMRTAGLKTRFVNGLRVTDEAAIKIVEETLDDEINPTIVSHIQKYGGKAVGVSGKNVFKAAKLPPQAEGRETVDLGFTGEVNGLILEEVKKAVEQEIVPVLSPIGCGTDGHALNVNADIAAGALAGALNANKIIFVSDVLGIMRDPREKDSLIPTVNSEIVEKLIGEEIIAGGMIPKVRSALDALEKGVPKAHLIDGRIPHSLLLEIFTSDGVGTEILR